MYSYRTFVTMLLATAALPVAADAQETAAPQPDMADIVVTAERRSQDVLKTPISVVALSGETLKQRGVTDLNSLQAQVPSLSFTDYGNNKYLNIRGIGLSESAPNQSVGVAVQWDGTYVAREFVFGDSFFDIASVEVLRGPQGTFTGQNASGGAIYITSVRPDFDGTSGFADLTLGNLGRKQIEAGITTQLSDTVAVRVSGQLERRNSAFTNLGPTGVASPVDHANQPGNLQRFLGRAQLMFKPTDDIDLLLIHQYSDRKSDGLPWQSFGSSTVGNRTVAYDTDQAQDVSYNRTTAILNYTGFSAFKVRAMGSYQTTNQLNIQDLDYRASVGGPSSQVIIEDSYYTGEIDLISPDNLPFTWTLGATFLNYKQPGITVPLITDAIPFGTGIYIFTDARRRNEAVFGEAGYKITPTLEIKVGGRYSWDHVGFAPSYLQPFGVGGFKLPLEPGMRDFSEFTGRAVVNWQVTDANFLYATVSKGYKPGGTTPFSVDYDSESVINYEAGWKARLFDGLLTTSISAFYMDYKGFQTTYTPDINNPTSAITRNVDGAKIKGIEGQFGINSDGFHADASFSVLDAKYGDLETVQPAGLFGNGLPSTPQLINLKGRTIPFAAKFSGAAGVSYDMPLGSGTLTPSARITYQGAQWVNFLQADYNRIPSRTLVGGRLTYKAENNWSLTLYAENLLNDDYIATVNQDTDGVGAYILGQPREFGVSLSYRF